MMDHLLKLLLLVLPPILLLLGGCDCNINLAEESNNLFEGDIDINEDEENALEHGEAEAGILGNHFRWEDGIIPYKISDEFDRSGTMNIKKAMQEISQKTCIRFKPRETEKDFVHYQNGRGCSSSVGRQNTGEQAITLMIPACVQSTGTIIHETIHAIGFWHEQSRTDRDKYIDINWKNIDEEKKHNFNKFTSKKIHDFNVPYDYLSVMHYPDQAFISDDAAKRQLKTIVPRVTGVYIGQRKGLSKLDALKVNRMYCPEIEKEKEILNTKPTKVTTTTTTTTSTTTTTRRPNYSRYNYNNYFRSRFLSSRNSMDRSWYKSRMLSDYMDYY